MEAKESDPCVTPVRAGLMHRFLSFEVRMEKLETRIKLEVKQRSCFSWICLQCRESNFRRLSWQVVKKRATHSFVLLLLGTHVTYTLSSRMEEVGVLTISSKAQ